MNSKDHNDGNVLTMDALSQALEAERAKGRTVVTANGCFDLFHVGHLRFLAEAKAQGDILVVGINSDASVRTYKAPDRPVNPEAHRAELVAALDVVDYVCIFDEPDPIALLSQIKPDVHVNGVEYGEDCIERQVVEENGGHLYLVRHSSEVSSTQLLEKIMRLYGDND